MDEKVLDISRQSKKDMESKQIMESLSDPEQCFLVYLKKKYSPLSLSTFKCDGLPWHPCGKCRHYERRLENAKDG